MLRRALVVLFLTFVAYLATNDAWSMIVMPPTGDAVLTSDQQTALNQQTAIDQERAFDAKVGSYLTWHHCQTVTAWKHSHPGAIPATMVQHLDHSNRLETVKWTYPASRGEYVVGVCG